MASIGANTGRSSIAMRNEVFLEFLSPIKHHIPGRSPKCRITVEVMFPIGSK